MLTKKQVKEIKEHLEKSQNPIFFFDNDADGLCSFLLLRRWIDRGQGFPIRSNLDKRLYRKVKELNADYIFVLDKPIIENDFFEEVYKNNIPLVWIDHHEINKSSIPKFVYYYNPVYNKRKSEEPVTFLCYQISKKKSDMWIYLTGCIADGFIPKESKNFKEKYPDLWIDSKNVFEIFYKSKIGKISRMFNFALKDKYKNVIKMIHFLIKVKEPTEILEEKPENQLMHKRFKYIEKKIKILLRKALSAAKKSDKIIFFKYSGKLSISADLSNELIYRFPNKIVIVVYISQMRANISGRGQNVKKYIIKAIENLENSRGGGHENAVGAQIMANDIEKFKRNMEALIE
ncbi:MAG: hypothetical protein QXX55_01705 [Candidatus Pacearchaeota archaeon]